MDKEFCKRKAEIIEKERFLEISGSPMMKLPGDLGDLKFPIPIQPCLCVTEPCICPPWTIYVDPTDIVDFERSKRGVGEEGEIVFNFRVKRTARLIFEEPIEMSANSFENLSDIYVTYQKKGKGSIRGLLLKIAFKVGQAIGTKLDDATGTSDWWGEALFDALGPAPDWLQDLADLFGGKK